MPAVHLSQNNIRIFDRALVRKRRDRAAHIDDAGAMYLFDQTAMALSERLDLVKRSFSVVLELGAANGSLTKILRQRVGVEHVISADFSPHISIKAGHNLVADEEFLPFAPASMDAVISNLALHWVNDLPGSLLQIRNILKPDGLFMATLLGGETLRELRDVMMQAEMNISGGASPRVSPLVDMRDMGALMQRAGFNLPVIDSEIVTVHYTHPFRLMHDLRAMGAANAVAARLRTPTSRSMMLEVARLYQEKYADQDGHVPASFEIIYVVGWSPHASQQKPMQPGTARQRLADALGTDEVKLSTE